LHPGIDVLLPAHLGGAVYDVHQQLAQMIVVLCSPGALSLVLHFNGLLRIFESILGPFGAGKAGRRKREREYKVESIFVWSLFLRFSEVMNRLFGVSGRFAIVVEFEHAVCI
jgi:hypothetical protein